jgi:putative colanic acid biosynthesis acetyltransferase WcaF
MTNRSPTLDETKAEVISLGSFVPTIDPAARSVFVRALWYFVSLVVFQSGWFPFYRIKCWLLRRFGASVGRGVVIKPNVRIKYPWRCRFGNHCWIGEDAWLDSLADIHLADNVCISQGVYLCTGSHDHRRSTFDLILKPITIEEGAWIAAKAIVLQGVRVGRGAVVAAGSVVTRDVDPGAIVAGNPCRLLAERQST